MSAQGGPACHPGPARWDRPCLSPNGLSVLSRRLPELVYNLVEELVASGDQNSYWIAYRACRNLVKHDPIRVMDLLQVDEYRYKAATYRKGDK